MSLTSPLTFTLSATILVALNVFLLLYWNRLRKKRERVFALFIVQISMVATVGLFLNNQFSFYESWSELFGTQANSKQIVQPNRIDLSKAQYTANGAAIIRETFTGSESKITASVWFLIPKGIVKAINEKSSEKFPVAYWLSGSPGKPTAWLHGLRLESQILKVQSEMNLKDFISVLPDFNVKAHADTGCMNIPGDVQVEDWLTKDVRSYVLENLPATNSDWLVSGYSTGGWCSAMLAIKNPTIFKAAAPIAGFYKPEFPFAISKSNQETLRKTYDLNSLASLDRSSLNIFLITSKADKYSYKPTLWFHKNLGSNNNVELLVLDKGGHNFNTWRAVVPDILRWYSQELT